MSFECSILFTPKFHCELAGEMIEYAWGMTKRIYRSMAMKLKRSTKIFNLLVRSCVMAVSLVSARRFSAKARRYMLIYHHLCLLNSKTIEDSQRLHEKIEKMNNVYRSHRDMNTIDGVFITEVIRDYICIKIEESNEIWNNTQPNDGIEEAVI